MFPCSSQDCQNSPNLYCTLALALLQGTPTSLCQETGYVGLHDSGSLPNGHCYSLQMPPSCRAPWLCTLGRGTRWTSPARYLPTPVPQSHGSEMVSCCPAPTTAISRSTTHPLPATWRWVGWQQGTGWRRHSLTIDGLLYAAKIPLASLVCPELGATSQRRNWALAQPPFSPWATSGPGRQSVTLSWTASLFSLAEVWAGTNDSCITGSILY